MAKQESILVVDDEAEIADLVALYLGNEDYRVIKCGTGAQALAAVDKEKLDLAILDVMLPDIDGFTICRRIRERYNFPVIMLTAKEGETDKITGLTLGADDYITKPFHPLELVARVKAQLRRFTKYNPGQNEEHEASVIAFSGLVLDASTHTFTLNEREVTLTPTEFAILWMLCENRGQVVPSEEIFHQVWGEKYYSGNNTIMVHIRHLREKMGDRAEKPKYIKTVWGVGYKIEA